MAGATHPKNKTFLTSFTPDQLRDSLVAQEWLKSVSHLDGSDNQKDLLLRYVGAELPVDRFDTALAITRRFASDDDQQDVYKRLVNLPQLRVYDSAYARPWLCAGWAVGPRRHEKRDLLLLYLDTSAKPQKTLPADQFDSVMAITGRLDASEDQKDILELLIGLPPATDAEWTGLIRATSALQPDEIKSGLLLKIAPKLPLDRQSSGAVPVGGKVDL